MIQDKDKVVDGFDFNLNDSFQVCIFAIDNNKDKDSTKRIILTTFKQASTYLSRLTTGSSLHRNHYGINTNTLVIEPNVYDSETFEYLKNQDIDIASRLTSIEHFYDSIINKKKITILYRNPIKRVLTGFSEDLLNGCDRPGVKNILGHASMQQLFVSACKRFNISESSKEFGDWAMFIKKEKNKEEIRIKNRFELFEQEYIKCTTAIIRYCIQKYIYSTSFVSGHYGPYLAPILNIISSGKISYELVDIDKVNLDKYLGNITNTQIDTSSDKNRFQNKWDVDTKKHILEIIQNEFNVMWKNENSLNTMAFSQYLSAEFNIYKTLSRDKNNVIRWLN